MPTTRSYYWAVIITHDKFGIISFRKFAYKVDAMRAAQLSNTKLNPPGRTDRKVTIKKVTSSTTLPTHQPTE